MAAERGWIKRKIAMADEPAAKKPRVKFGGVEEIKVNSEPARKGGGGGGGGGNKRKAPGGVNEFTDEHDVPAGPEQRQQKWSDEDEADAGYVFNDDGANDDDDDDEEDDKRSSRRMTKKFAWEVDKPEEEVSKHLLVSASRRR